jgi:hypothetical protein
VVGSAPFSLGAGVSVKLTLRLDRAARELLVSKGRRRAELMLVGRDRGTSMAPVHVIVRAPRPARLP